jgi:osmotically-inducible protein OsmY
MNDKTFPSSTPAFAATLRRAALLVLLTGSLAACSVMRGQESVGQYTDDARITAEIKSNMAADKAVAATSISVETLNGVTQLSGFAKTQVEKERASEIARQAKGVRAVRNDIIVRQAQ